MGVEAHVTTYVVGDRLPWPDDGPGVPGKGDYERAVLHGPSGRSDGAIRKISALGATIAAEQGGPAGAPVAIELGYGRRCGGRIDWARGGEIGVAFDEPIDILALINRNLVAQPVERRMLPRVELRFPAHLKWGEHLAGALTRNISARGMQLEGEDLPPVGTYTSIFVEGLNLPPCEMVWRRGSLGGVEFFEELSWASIIPWVKGVSRTLID